MAAVFIWQKPTLTPDAITTGLVNVMAPSIEEASPGEITLTPGVITVMDLFANGPSVSISFGYATLPQAVVDTSLPSNINDAADHPVTTGAQFTTALSSCVDGDVIEITAGSTISGNFTLRDRGTGNVTPVVIRSSGYGSLPAGTRVGPSDTANMAKIEGSSSFPHTIRADHNADGYRLVGLEITKTENSLPNDLLRLGYSGAGSWATTVADVPEDIIIDRCYLHGSTTAGTKVGIAMNANDSAVIDSHISQIAIDNDDSQAVWAHNGGLTVKVDNNYLEATGENIMTGGAANASADLIPSDWTITGNHFFKPLTWNPNHGSYAGTPYSIKNCLEVKFGQRFLIKGNVFENCWVGDQDGACFNLKSVGNNAAWSVTQDITIESNVIRNMAGVCYMSGLFAGATQAMNRIYIHNNLIYDLGDSVWHNGTARAAFQFGGSQIDTVVINNTVQADTRLRNTIIPEGTNTGTIFRDNILPEAQYGCKRSGTAGGQASMDAGNPNNDTQNNIFINATYPWAGGLNITNVASEAALLYVDAANDDYQLQSGSAGYQAGTGGNDIGCDVDAVETLTAGVV